MKKTININDHMPKDDTAGFRIEQEYGRIRTWFADLLGWLLAPILNPWMAKLTVNAELVEAKMGSNGKRIFALNQTIDSILNTTGHPGDFQHDNTLRSKRLDDIEYDIATIKEHKDLIDKVFQYLGVGEWESSETGDIYIKWMNHVNQQLEKLEEAFNLVKPNINKVEQLDKFMSVIVTKMDWKLMDEPGARKDNLESWTCGLLNSMNRSQLAMERLLGLKLGDTAADDRLEKIDEFHNQFKDVNNFMAGLMTLLELRWITQTSSDDKYKKKVLVSRWIEQHDDFLCTAECVLGYDAPHHGDEYDSEAGTMDEFAKVLAVAVLLGEQRNQDVNAYLTWRAKIDATVKDHSERLHDLDNMHNLD